MLVHSPPSSLAPSWQINGVERCRSKRVPSLPWLVPSFKPLPKVLNNSEQLVLFSVMARHCVFHMVPFTPLRWLILSGEGVSAGSFLLVSLVAKPFSSWLVFLSLWEPGKFP